ncbi:sulfatase-like hydrolase/transferase [Armatimonas sp.]|uniref:sulfatase-like hydrolase/transferase n=1 Tax=Armatimonas sp. TaxID=1872638 RepID=UPI00286BD64A|nr:sulfatase-like hydrolase/transferase [Armatimonas sp.]
MHFKLITLAISLLFFVCAPTLADTKKPNIIVFLVDDMGWQETSVPFHTEVTELNRRYHTPNMERLAAEGMKFTQAYASAVCSPSRVSMLSGMNVARHRVTNWTLRKDRSPDNESKFVEPPLWNLNGVTTEASAARTTRITPLPALLKAVGYHTIHAGKAHFGAKDTPGEDPKHLGFDVNIAGHAAGGPGSYWGEKNFSAAWRTNPPDTIWDVPGLSAYHGKDVYLTEVITQEALKAMEKSVVAKRPFYLYLSHYAIHAPWEKDTRFYQKYLDADLKPFEATLASMIEGMDKSLGDVMDALKRLHVDKNTILLFLSDNGSPSQCPQNLPLRGHKITPYEGGIRVPMLAKWPGVTKPRSVNTNPVVVEDFFPTVLELAGITKPTTVQAVDGKSFVPLLKGSGGTSPERAFVWHFPHQYSGTPFSAVRQGPWKLIYHHISRKRELFNLDNDIGETTDLATVQPDKTDELAKVLGERLRALDAQLPMDKAKKQPVEWPDRLPPQEKSTRQVDVYLLGGQSNMQGIGEIADLPADVPRALPNTLFWTGKAFEPLILGTTKTSARPTEFGPEVGFALGTVTTERPLYLIKYHASGMPLHHGWDGNSWVGGEPAASRRNFYPGERPDDTNTGTLYTEMCRQFQSGLQHLREQGLTPRVCGFVWMQGEQDAKHQDSATAYAASLNRLRRRLTEDMQCATDLPLVFGQVLPHEPPAPRFTHRKELREQMAACDSTSGKPEAMKNTRMVSTDGFSLMPDTVHYDATGQLALGKAFAAAMAKLRAVSVRSPSLRQAERNAVSHSQCNHNRAALGGELSDGFVLAFDP